MALFSSWFKGKPGAPDGQAPAPSANPDSSADTVAASTSIRQVTPSQPKYFAAADTGAQRPVSLRSNNPPPTTPLPATRNLSVRSEEQAAPETPRLPPMRAMPPPPVLNAPDMVVNLEIGDFVDRIPTNFLGAAAVDRRQRVEFRASELYSDLARGRATVPASVIYQKCPNIFARPVSETEDVEVHLPLDRLVEQLGGAFSARADQMPEENVAEIDTPFLQVAKEDDVRLAKGAGAPGSATVRAIGLPTARHSNGPVVMPVTTKSVPPPNDPRKTKQISPISPLKPTVETRAMGTPGATQQPPGPINSSKRPPSTVRASVAGGKIRLSAPGGATRSQMPQTTPTVPHPSEATRVYTPASPRIPASAPSSPSHQVTKKTARIQIPPISLRPAAPGAARPPATPETPPASSAPFPGRAPEPLTSFKPTGRAESSASTPPTFRSTPPPPSVSKSTAPPLFTPTRLEDEAPRADLMTHENKEEAPAAAPALDGQTIELSLAAILRGLPESSIVVEPTSLPENARASFPFHLIQPQLCNGRVSVPTEAFRAALPGAYNHVLSADCDLTEIPLPLQEIFQNLPANAISQREDQVIEEARNAFPTPFSQKAEEDARRFGVPTPEPPAAPTPREVYSQEPKDPLTDRAEVLDAVLAELPASLVETPALEKKEEPAQPEEAAHVESAVAEPIKLEEPEPQKEPLKEAGDPLEQSTETAPSPSKEDERPKPQAAPLKDSQLQTLFMTEDALDAKAIARLVSQLPGLESCSVIFGDGLLLAGSHPSDGQTEGFSAMAPALLQRMINFTKELSAGEFQGCTLYTDQGLLSLFMQDNICLSVRHTGRGFLPGVREKLNLVSRELAAMYGDATPSQDQNAAS